MCSFLSCYTGVIPGGPCGNGGNGIKDKSQNINKDLSIIIKLLFFKFKALVQLVSSLFIVLFKNNYLYSHRWNHLSLPKSNMDWGIKVSC